MTKATSSLLGLLLGGAAICCAAQDPAPAPNLPAATEARLVEVEIPQQVAEAAVKKAAGDLAAPPPVLVLEGLEVDPRQSLTLEVRAAGDPSRTEPGPVLAVTGTVGAPSDPNAPARQKMTLQVPLGGEASRLLAEAQKAGRKKIVLELHSDGQKLVCERVYFQVTAPPEPP